MTYRREDPHNVAALMQALVISMRQDPPRLLNGRSWLSVHAGIDEDRDVGVVLLGSFAFFTLVAAALIIANAVTGQVQAQTRDIGLLKAIGVTPPQVMLLFAGEVAVVAGQLVAPAFVDDLRAPLGTAQTGSPGLVVSTVIFMLVTGIAVIAALIPAWRAGRSGTAQAVAGGRVALGRSAARRVTRRGTR